MTTRPPFDTDDEGQPSAAEQAGCLLDGLTIAGAVALVVMILIITLPLLAR